MRNVFLAASAIGFLCAAGAASAQVKGQQYFGLGGGGGMLMQGQSCPDIQCNTGDKCTCITSTGSLTVKGLGGYQSQATYQLEVSADNTTGFNNGAGGHCFGSTGTIVLTIGTSDLTIPFSGTGCRLGSGKVSFGISAPAYVASGTGKYANWQGTGSFAGTFDPTSQTVLFDINGYAGKSSQ